MSISLLRFTVLGAVAVAASAAETDPPPLRSLAFGSCAKEDKPQPAWESIRREQPDVFVFLGDNIYADTTDPAVMAAKYRQLGALPGFAALRRETRLLATWDDHDYGQNDAGAEYPQKDASRRLFLGFFSEPAASPRWTQAGGLYTAHTFGPPGRRVQVILLDLRWGRTPLRAVTRAQYDRDCVPKNLGPYLPDADSQARLIADEQWAWLEARLREPAEVRLIGSSIQCLAEFTGWESWANFPHERARLFGLIRRTGAAGVVLLSGDTHWAELSRVEEGAPYPLWELTSSGLTEEWKQVSPNRHRLGRAFSEANYGLIEFFWDAAEPHLVLNVKAADGRLLLQQGVPLSSLRPPQPRS